MKKKGFTLIELLAVIVILAIIALIATPIILNMIENARKSAAADSAYGYIEAIEYNNSMADLGINNNYTKITDGKDLDVTGLDVKVKGTKPSSGVVTISKGRVAAANLCVDGFSVIYNGEKVTEVTKGNECASSTSKEETVYKDYEIGELVWFDPVGYKYCKEGENNCYSWIVLNNNKEKRNLDLIYAKDENSLKWSKDLLTVLNEYTSSWNDKLFVDYNYNLETYFDYSNSKARIPLVSEMSDAIHKKLNDNGSCADSSNSCVMANIGTGKMTRFWYEDSEINSGDMMEFQYISPIPNYYIHPVINIGSEKNATPEEIYVSQRKDKYENGDIIYLNPKDLQEECTAKNSKNEKGKTEGCMKWYAFLDSKDNSKVKLLLAHNTTATTCYNSVSTELNKLKWNLNERVIKADEVAQIIDVKTFNSSTSSSRDYFHFDVNDEPKEKYVWLFDYSNGCDAYGCKNTEYSTQGYWTSEQPANEKDNYAWAVSSLGFINYYGLGVCDIVGVRPVIEIERSLIK
ncbi:MAG: prepilin-type N-terminal cleavage/methylation domain-containing protein [Lactobacillales bacterium]|nr:prepilin-type N-terminal cleavage/methylation domain-containing protein [Lactobacillales bacterium]